MPVTLEEVRKMIRQAFEDADVDGVTVDRGRITGFFVAKEFGGKDPEERNRLVTARVRDPLGLRGLNLGVLFPLAPGEHL